jgi:hypothetical protein
MGDALAEDERQPGRLLLDSDIMPASATTVTSGNW